jgi:DHA2 family multidrug resistance protein
MVAEQTQVHRAHLAANLTQFSQPYQHLLSQYSDTLRSFGESTNGALGMINQMLNQQAAILAYLDVFLVCAIAAFCVVPFAFLFRPSISGGEPAGH